MRGGGGGSKLPHLYTRPIYDFDLRATHALTLLPAALASVSFGFVLVRVRVRMIFFATATRNSASPLTAGEVLHQGIVVYFKKSNNGLHHRPLLFVLGKPPH